MKTPMDELDGWEIVAEGEAGRTGQVVALRGGLVLLFLGEAVVEWIIYGCIDRRVIGGEGGKFRGFRMSRHERRYTCLPTYNTIYSACWYFPFIRIHKYIYILISIAYIYPMCVLSMRIPNET